jgi:DNA-binding transcriptional MerR regulator
VPPRADVPDKLYFKIGEVAALVGVKPYVLRYWESEFKAIKPAKTRSKHRLYRKADIEVLRQIKHLLYNERLTIEGAKKRLKPGAKEAPSRATHASHDAQLRAVLGRVKKEIELLHRMLS